MSMTEEQIKAELEREERSRLLKALWNAMEDDATAIRLVEIAREHTRLARELSDLLKIEFQAGRKNAQMSADTLRFRMARLAEEREALLLPFYDEA